MIKEIKGLFLIFYKEHKLLASGGAVVLVLIALSTVGLDLAFNHWRSIFWTAVEQKNITVFTHQLWVFASLAFTSIGLYTALTYIGQRYCLKWRKTLSTTFLERWVVKLKQGNSCDNADQRLQQDLADFTSMCQSLFLGIITSLTVLIVFLPLLAHLGAPLIAVLGVKGTYWLPIACLLLSASGMTLSFFIGKKIPSLEIANQRTEADYRYRLIHLRDGEPYCRKLLTEIFNALYTNHLALYSRYKSFNLASNCFFQAAVIVPVLLVVPSYLKGAILFGVIMAVLDAFNKVCQALNWVLDNFLTICRFKATLIRLVEFDKQLGD